MQHERLARTRSKLLTAILLTASLWCALAIYYSDLLDGRARLIATLLFLGFGFWATLSRHDLPKWMLWLAIVAIVGGWVFRQPSNDRQWRPEVAVAPSAVIDGDRVRVHRRPRLQLPQRRRLHRPI